MPRAVTKKASSTSKKEQFDVIIVGGGPAGLTLGAGLVHFMPELRVAICDRRPIAVPDDARSLALAAGVARIYEVLGIWEEMKRDACPIKEMKITDSGPGDRSRPLLLSFEGEVSPGQPFAHMVPFRTLVGALLKKAQENVTFLAPVQVDHLKTGSARANLFLSDGTLLKAGLIVAADGARSQMRSKMGIRTIVSDYHQSGLVTTIAHELDHLHTAYEHFRPAGPFASLPLPGKCSSLVWTERSPEAERLKRLDQNEQARHIENSMGHCLGSVEVMEPIQSFSLRLCLAREFVRSRFALLGDAAHGIHPITGQGLNLGLKDVAALIEVIIDSVRMGEDHGALNVLERYQRWRRMDVAMMAMATDGLNRMFSNDVASFRALRDLGLGVVDRMPVLKKALIRHAAGISGSGPKLLQGLDL